MTLRKFVGIAALTGLLAACSMSLSPEQQAEIDREYRPQVNAFLPACIATASGQKADYSAILALGFTQRKAVIGTGDYLYPANGASLLSDEGIKFVPGEGCHANHDGFTAVDMRGLNDLGKVWVGALQAAGYQDTGGNSSSYDFTANGVKMRFEGHTTSQSGILSFSITRAK